MSSPQLDSGIDQPAQVFAMDRLSSHTQSFGDLSPAPSGAHGGFHCRIFQAVSQLAQCHGSCQIVGWAADWWDLRGHTSNCS